MPFVTLTANVPAGAHSDPFVNDADGLECIQFGTVTPPTVQVVNLSGGFYNISDNWRNAACAVTLFEPQFTIGPTNPIVRTVGGGSATTGMGWNYHNVTGPATLRIRVDWSAPGLPCEFGTQRRPLTQAVYFITPELITTFLAVVEAPWLAIYFVILFFLTFDADQLCGTGPPALPTINNTPSEMSFQTIFQVWQVVAWFNLCECKPGTPAPIPPTQPVFVQPPGTPAAPTFTCNGADLCATLILMQRQLASLSTGLSSINQLVTLLQRYSLPFAYIRGATHSNISSPTSFAISRLVGVRVHVTARPADLQTFTGIPTYVTDLGWLSIVTGDGLVDEIRLTRDDQTWLPRLMPLAVTLGVGLREGVTVAVQELQAEP